MDVLKRPAVCNGNLKNIQGQYSMFRMWDPVLETSSFPPIQPERALLLNLLDALRVIGINWNLRGSYFIYVYCSCSGLYSFLSESHLLLR